MLSNNYTVLLKLKFNYSIKNDSSYRVYEKQNHPIQWFGGDNRKIKVIDESQGIASYWGCRARCYYTCYGCRSEPLALSSCFSFSLFLFMGELVIRAGRVIASQNGRRSRSRRMFSLQFQRPNNALHKNLNRLFSILIYIS